MRWSSTKPPGRLRPPEPARGRATRVTVALLSKWDERVVGIHERTQVGEPRGEMRQGMNAEPGQQEAGTDERLEEEPQVSEPMVPTGIVGPGRMLRRHGGRFPGMPGTRAVR